MFSMTKNYLHEHLYTWTFVLWSIASILYDTTLRKSGRYIDLVYGLNEATDIIILTLLLAQILFFQKYRFRELIIIAIVSIPVVISAWKSVNYVFLSAWLFVLAAKNIPFRRMIETTYRVLVIAVPIIIVLYFSGVLGDVFYYRNGIRRYALGFVHPNILGLRILQLNICHFYLRKDDLKVHDYIMGLVSVAFIAIVPASQTSFICNLILVILFFARGRILGKSTKGRWGFLQALIVMTVLCNILSLAFSLVDTSSNIVLKLIDNSLSRRFYHCYRDINLFGISLLGQHLPIKEQESYAAGLGRLFLDNTYVGILLWYGIIVYLLFSIAYPCAMIRFKRRGDDYIVIVLFLYAIYGVMDLGTYMLTNNVFLLAFSEIIYNKDMIFSKTDYATIHHGKRFEIVGFGRRYRIKAWN